MADPGAGTTSPGGESCPRIGFSLVITTCRETEVLAGSLPRIAAALRALDRRAEIVFVDDGSGDGTAEWVEAQRGGLADLSPRLLRHAVNRGRGATLRTGFAAVRGETTGYLDLDLEVDVAYLPRMLAALDTGADVAIGCRTYVRTRPGFDLRTFLSLGYRRLSRLVLRHGLEDTEAGFKFFRTTALARLLPHAREDGWFFDTEIVMLARLARMRIEQVPVDFRRRDDKVSNVKIARDVGRYLVALSRFPRRRRALAAALR